LAFKVAAKLEQVGSACAAVGMKAVDASSAVAQPSNAAFRPPVIVAIVMMFPPSRISEQNLPAPAPRIAEQHIVFGVAIDL
jgi:hypothetical protein